MIKRGFLIVEGEVDLVENEISRMNAELKDAKGIITHLKGFSCYN